MAIVNLNDTPSRGPLTADDLARYRNLHRVTLPNCAGPCDQGRKLCPVPEACEASEVDNLDASCVIVWVLGTIGAWAAIIAFLLVLRS